MGSQVDYVRKKFGPLQSKTLANALAHRIGKEFPRIGGPRILKLCAEMILEVLARHVRPAEHVTHGQTLWMAVKVDDPPGYHQSLTDVELVPVVLDVSTAQDVEARIERLSAQERLRRKVVRLCEQAFAQGGLLSNCDLAELLCVSDSHVAGALVEHERKTGKLVPRRATVHDVGSGLTHKRIICYKRYAEGKDASKVAEETYHSLEAVDRYLGQYDRVRHCRLHGMDAAQTAHALGCSVRLVEEYLAIDRDLERNAATPPPATAAQTSKLDPQPPARTIQEPSQRIGQC
jgi:hypothetical protein